MIYEDSTFSRFSSTIGNFGNSTVDATNSQYGLVTTTHTLSYSLGDLSKSEAKI
ncbi:hypothetical protein [Candidatus Ruthturnera calyptogenae]|uniref:hypothetical protein n=1 Tax=Candidatus Ruthturnera calyptogenae TaxID=386487 RepID=UPI0002DBA0C8|nr:hypothetical protein [Candidatus Ruthturnera calyptogenae]